MKNLILLLIVLFFSFNMNAQEKASIGMTIEEVSKIYPGLTFSGKYENKDTYERPDTVYGLDEVWGYRFENGNLEWIYFHKYIDEINEKNFIKCLAATEKLIYEYSKCFGNPDSLIKGDRKFRDPYKDQHYGYNVLEARWKNYNGMKIKVEFTFMGGKGEYHFLVNVNYFDKSYPYYD